jgi:hypothetical protein
LGCWRVGEPSLGSGVLPVINAAHDGEGSGARTSRHGRPIFIDHTGRSERPLIPTGIRKSTTGGSRDFVCHRHESPGDVVGCGRLFSELRPDSGGARKKPLCSGMVEEFVEHSALAQRRVRVDLRRTGLERSRQAGETPGS